MRPLHILNRRLHYWLAIAAALPLLVMIGSGLLLQSKKHWTWVQPAEHRGSGTVPAVGFEEILAALQGLSGMEVRTWKDVRRLDVRPGRGVAKAWLTNGFEVQIDLGTGRVLHSAYRRSDLIESLHDGSYFGGDLVKLGLFLPAGIVLLLLWLSGLWLWWMPIRVRLERARKARRARD
ncbi:MAG: PepSY domain-containing protein [Thermoanaerobaculia bacterium]|nr:PepSY domain-containing protein [Thermoanaerobaculia bacterium]